MKIGYLHFYGLGDNIFAMEALFALKKIFACELIVFGNENMQNLLRYCEFVDCVHDIKGDVASHVDTINSYSLDYVILTNCKRCYLRPLEKTNARKIITATKIPSLFSLRCKTIPLNILPKYKVMSRRQQSLCFVRAINPKLFDSKIDSICLDDAKIQATSTQRKKAKELVLCYVNEGGRGVNHALILINPFSKTANHTLPLESYLEIMFLINCIKDCIPVVATYPEIHDSFTTALSKWEGKTRQKISKLLIFQNDNDILNIVALIEQMKCVISPSTGTIHLASNLCVPTIGLFSQYDTIKWSTKSNQYVILPKPKDDMSADEISDAITKTMRLLKETLRKHQDKTS